MIIWITSYPKSGNTWIRSLLSSYLFSKDGIFNFEHLKNIKQFSSKNFDDLNESRANYQDLISMNWIPSQKIINEDNKLHYLKTHNAMCAINGNNFTNKSNTLAAIYIVRDPRNIITSLSNHYGMSLDESYKFITNKKKIIYPIAKNKKSINDFNFLGDWSFHYNSWKNIKFCPVKIIKYEDILSNTYKVFISILNFLSEFQKIIYNEPRINNSIKTTSFKNLSEMENNYGFEESNLSAKTNKKVKFFHLGKKNDWKKILDDKNIKKIETTFNREMHELNYL